MIQLKKNRIKKCGWHIFGICLLSFLVVLLIPGKHGMANSELPKAADIALYQGTDRAKILLDGAKREGQLTFYNSYSVMASVARAFEKKYPFIKVLDWRNGSMKVFKRVSEEYAAKRYSVDVIQTNHPLNMMYVKNNIFQEYYLPESNYFPDELKLKGKKGYHYLGDMESYVGLGFNTQLIPPSKAPKTYEDLLDAKWKGKMTMNVRLTGIRWFGTVLDAMGREYLEKLKLQNIKFQTISSRAIANLIVAGEVPLSPAIYDANIIPAKKKGASVEWRPLEPVLALVNYSGIASKAPHPHAAMLFLDYLHSKEGQMVIMQSGLRSPRKDIGSLEQKFKKSYQEAQYPVFEEYKKHFDQWESIRKQFMQRKP
jgi:iron(III) transport system substrate-binding protein